MNKLIETITSSDPALKDRSFISLIAQWNDEELVTQLQDLELFRRSEKNLYFKVRSCMFLYAGYNHLVNHGQSIGQTGHLPYVGYKQLLERNYEEAIRIFSEDGLKNGANATVLSGIAKAYHHLSFKILYDQVRKSVRSSVGNQWLFRGGHRDDHAIRIIPPLLNIEKGSSFYPILNETTPVRLDLSHSGWSDIFFLGMDYPEGANVINISVDLGVYMRDTHIVPPIQSFVRVIPEPLLRLTSVDLNTTKDIVELSELFNFGNDYLSLVKAGVIASGLIPPSFEGTNQKLSDILSIIVGKNMGLEIVTHVNDIPKGSRLAVSTNLLASIVSNLMRATGQTQKVEGDLTENERRLVASRAILGEWLGGSGGGWQDSGGVWPGIKWIHGEHAQKGDPEYTISKGCLLPRHELITEEKVQAKLYENLSKSLVVFHGGMAQNVGPILEMVSERYLLRSDKEWKARQHGNALFSEIKKALLQGNIKKLAQLIMQNWEGPLKDIIPWVSNKYTETLIQKAKDLLKDDFYGFLMLGGMSGGGMGIFVNPDKMAFFKKEFQKILLETKQEFKTSMPFAMDPVVYNFAINRNGTFSALKKGNEALMPSQYYELHAANMVEHQLLTLNDLRRAEIDYYATNTTDGEKTRKLLLTLMGSVFKVSDVSIRSYTPEEDTAVKRIKDSNGFDYSQHEALRKSMQKGSIGLSRNRLPDNTSINDIEENSIKQDTELEHFITHGNKAIKNQEVAVLSLAAGIGTRWTNGAGVIKAINPFVQMQGKHRDFVEIHLAKTIKTAQKHQVKIPHIFATSYLTHQAIESYFDKNDYFGIKDQVLLSPGKSIGQRFVPMARDLTFLWEELNDEVLDEQKQKVKEASRKALINWAQVKGEANDYSDNVAAQRLSPLGHWYEVSNLIRNGVLNKLLTDYPNVKTLMLHNIDTLGVNINEGILGYHLKHNNALTFEVIPRVIDDRGGGLANVNGQLRLLEGLAQPNEEDEFKLKYYNSMTTWINIDQLLELFNLTRSDLSKPQEFLDQAVRSVAKLLPTYLTIKDVKYRWGNGQEDIYPVSQVEKLWSDMSVINELKVDYVAVSRMRGQQLKDPDQLDEWYYNGSKDYVEGLAF